MHRCSATLCSITETVYIARNTRFSLVAFEIPGGIINKIGRCKARLLVHGTSSECFDYGDSFAIVQETSDVRSQFRDSLRALFQRRQDTYQNPAGQDLGVIQMKCPWQEPANLRCQSCVCWTLVRCYVDQYTDDINLYVLLWKLKFE